MCVRETENINTEVKDVARNEALLVNLTSVQNLFRSFL